MIASLIVFQATFGFLNVPNVAYDGEESRLVSEGNFRKVECYTVNWPWVQFLTNAKRKLIADHWTIEDHRQGAVGIIYFNKGNTEICYSKPEGLALATFTIYQSTPYGRKLAAARQEFLLWLSSHAASQGFTLKGDFDDDNTVLFPFGVTDTLFYIGGRKHAPFKLYRFDKGNANPIWSLPLGPYKGKRSELVGTLRRYLGNANSARNTVRNEMVIGEIPALAKRDLEVSMSLVHMYQKNGSNDIQGGFIEPSGIAQYINNSFVGRECQSPWEEEKAYIGNQ